MSLAPGEPIGQSSWRSSRMPRRLARQFLPPSHVHIHARRGDQGRLSACAILPACPPTAGDAHQAPRERHSGDLPRSDSPSSPSG
ncbi:hypothetical protein FBG13_00270 [Cobetia marina]|nr:hypothetical protein FBG13_00270 [Cobetia marina]